MKKIYILVCLLFLFSGCSTTVPAVVKYKISPIIALEEKQISTCKTKSIKVSSAFTNSSLMSKDMSYVLGNSKVYEYSESAWLNNPNRAVSREYIKMLRALGIYKSVQESKSRSRADLIIEIDLEDFMQYYSEDLKTSYSIVHINLSIIDFNTSEIISTKTFKSKVNATKLDANGGVKALNTALKNVLSQSAKWFIKGCS